MTQEELNKLAKNDTNGLLDCYTESTMQEFAIGIQQYEAGFKKALELVFMSIKHYDDNTAKLFEDLLPLITK